MASKKGLTFGGKVKSIFVAAFVMAIGISLFKFVPMRVFGDDILFDASLHLTLTAFVLYVFWYFVDQNVSWRIPYLFFSFAVVMIVAVQRIIAGAHNWVGLLAGFLVSAFAVVFSRWDYFKGKFSF